MGLEPSRLSQSQPKPVAAVDLRRYAGKWYQIGALPAWFQDPAAWNTTATYTYETHLGAPRLRVVNESETPGGPRRIEGIAEPDPSCMATEPAPGAPVPGCLLVQFKPSRTMPVVAPVPAPYWILELADDYSYAVVGEPDRKMLWLLARTPELAERDWLPLRERLLRVHGYSAEQLDRLAATAHYTPAAPRVQL